MTSFFWSKPIILQSVNPHLVVSSDVVILVYHKDLFHLIQSEFFPIEMFACGMISAL